MHGKLGRKSKLDPGNSVRNPSDFLREELLPPTSTKEVLVDVELSISRFSSIHRLLDHPLQKAYDADHANRQILSSPSLWGHAPTYHYHKSTAILVLPQGTIQILHTPQPKTTPMLRFTNTLPTLWMKMLRRTIKSSPKVFKPHINGSIYKFRKLEY